MRTNDDPPTTSEIPASSARLPVAAPKQVLIVAPDVPYPDDYGGARDMWHRIRLLADRGHALSLIATYRDEERRAAFESAPESATFRRRALFPIRPWRGVATPLPYAVGSRLLARPAVAAVGFDGTTFDVVEIEGLQAVGTFLQIRRGLSYRRALVRLFNRESAFQLNQARSEPRFLRRTLLAADAGRFFMFERFGRWKRAVDAGLFISRDELDHPNFAGIARRVLVAPPVPVDGPPALPDDFARREDLLLYVGNLRLPDNRAAVLVAHRELRDLLRRHDWRLTVCGRSDDPGALAELRDDPRVRLAFNVTADELERLYARAKVFVGFSENGAGAKLKLLEPLQRGIPIVATRDAVAGSDLGPAVVLWTDGGGGEPRRTLVELMTVAERWQTFRVAAYRLWREANARATAEYLRAVE